ncbi:hypothetical protein JW823_07215 [bacterium]|nr:hypothetical protein [candidate division CSSED10-310 bacterium]
MERICNVAKNHREAGEWDIKQNLRLTPNERMKIARILRERVFGKNTKDVREWNKIN